MNNSLKVMLRISALAAIIFSPISYAANTVIDVLVVYTKGSTDLYGADPSTRFNQIFQVTNQIYKDSGVDLEIRLVKSQLVDYTDDNDAGIALNDITYAKVPAFSAIATLRDQVKADMVILYRPYKANHGSCGIAWIGGGANGDFSNHDWTKYMYAHIAITSCGDYVTAHELGHNMGLKHSRKQDGSGGAFPYALGYGVVNQFTTIMAYQTSFNVDYWSGKLYKFSNPNLKCKDLPCGIDRSDAQNGADAHYALNITGPQIAKFTVADVGATSSQSATSSIAASSKSSAISSSSVVKSSAAKSSMAKSSISNTVLDALLAKVTSTKATYDAAQAAVDANNSAVLQKAATEAALLTALTKAIANAAVAKTANDTAIQKSKDSIAAAKALQIKVAAALMAYNKSTAATKDANKKIYDDLLASYNLAKEQSTAATAALTVAKNNATVTAAALTKAKSDYTTAQKATLTEKALSAKLISKVAPALAAYEAAKKAYDAAKPSSATASFTRVANVAQYKGADWKNEVRREVGISVDRAKEIAASDPNITYFFITTGYRMILEGSASWTDKGVFYFGDTVFFSGKPWYGSAPGLADAYEKSQ